MAEEERESTPNSTQNGDLGTLDSTDSQGSGESGESSEETGDSSSYDSDSEGDSILSEDSEDSLWRDYGIPPWEDPQFYSDMDDSLSHDDSEEESDDEVVPEGCNFDYDSDEYEYRNGMGGRSFLMFTRLPPELRRYIWELYCPELTEASRVFDFGVDKEDYQLDDSAFNPENYTMLEGLNLRNATRKIRKVLSVHGESRQLALRALPDTLAFKPNMHRDCHLRRDRPCPATRNAPILCEGLIHFHKERDIIIVGTMPMWREGWGDPSKLRLNLGFFADTVRNVAFMPTARDLNVMDVEDCRMTFGSFPNLKNIFYCQTFNVHSYRSMRWLAEPACRHHMVKHIEKFGPHNHKEVTAYLYCWPEPDRISELEIPRRFSRVVRGLESHAAEKGWNMLPMIYFGSRYEMKYYREILDEASRLQAKRDEPGEDSSDDNSASDLSLFEEEQLFMEHMQMLVGTELMESFLHYGPPLDESHF